MNRTLRRPMFRMGGAAEGITSGLDRKPLKDGDDPYDRALKTTERAQQDLEKFRMDQGAFMPGRFPAFLTQFGLNLATTPSKGPGFSGLVASAAEAAKEPFQTFQAAKLAEREDKMERAEDIFSGALASEYDLEAQRIKNLNKSGDKALPEVEAQLIKQAQNNIFDARDILAKPGVTADEKKAAERKIVLNQNVLQKELGVPAEYQAILTSEEIFNSYKSSYVEAENNKRISEYRSKNPDATEADLAENVQLIDEDSPEASDFTIAELRKKYYFASGGRVGLKFGSEPRMMESVAEQPRGEVQDLSYTELRARLPREISNDIVQLLSNSKQALLDFANIQTAEDIAGFNQQYDVNLTLPQGA